MVSLSASGRAGRIILPIIRWMNRKTMLMTRNTDRKKTSVAIALLSGDSVRAAGLVPAVFQDGGDKPRRSLGLRGGGRGGGGLGRRGRVGGLGPDRVGR